MADDDKTRKPNHHDLFVRGVLGNVELARKLFHISLPDTLIKIIEGRILAREPETFIAPEMKEYFTDLLFSVNRPGNPKLYMIFEHKSYKDPNLYIQLLGYIHQIVKSANKLVPVFPVIFHHRTNEWNIPSTYREAQKLDEELQSLEGLLDFRPAVINVRNLAVGDDKKDLIRAFLLTLKILDGPGDQERVTELIGEIREVFFLENDLNFIERMLGYIAIEKDVSPKQVAAIIGDLVSPKKGQEAMTQIEKMMQEKELEGILKGKIEAARAMLEDNYPLADVMKITKLSEQQLKDAGLFHG